jgi:hypothetical protein
MSSFHFARPNTDAAMATLATKYGPAEGGGVTADAAAGRLEAYARAAQAALEARDGPLPALVLLLSDEQLGGLFAPRQLAVLVKRPLGRPARNCA